MSGSCRGSENVEWRIESQARSEQKVTGTRVPAGQTGQMQTVESDPVDHGGSDRGTVSSGSIRTAVRSRAVRFVSVARCCACASEESRTIGRWHDGIWPRRRQAKDV